MYNTTISKVFLGETDLRFIQKKSPQGFFCGISCQRLGDTPYKHAENLGVPTSISAPKQRKHHTFEIFWVDHRCEINITWFKIAKAELFQSPFWEYHFQFVKGSCEVVGSH